MKRVTKWSVKTLLQILLQQATLLPSSSLLWLPHVSLWDQLHLWLICPIRLQMKDSRLFCFSMKVDNVCVSYPVRSHPPAFKMNEHNYYCVEAERSHLLITTNLGIIWQQPITCSSWTANLYAIIKQKYGQAQIYYTMTQQVRSLR